MSMIKMRNFTLHKQGPAEIALAAQYGFDLNPEPEGVLVEVGEEGFKRAKEELIKKLVNARNSQEAVLIGGHTGVLAAAVAYVAWIQLLPALYFFETERVRDENDRFVFKPIALRRAA